MPVSRGGHALNIAIPSMEPNTGWLIYDGALVPPRGIPWGLHDAPAAMDRAMARLHASLTEDAAPLAVVHALNPRARSPRCRGFIQARRWFQDDTQVALG